MQNFERICRKDGAINIPKSLREMLGLVQGQPVKLTFDSRTRSLRITPTGVSCASCGKELKHYTGLYGLCPDCQIKLKSYLTKGMSLDAAYKQLKVDAKNLSYIY